MEGCGSLVEVAAVIAACLRPRKDAIIDQLQDEKSEEVYTHQQRAIIQET